MEAYQRPFDPLRSVVCIDEMNRQLVEETRIPCEAGWPEKVDSEYVRKGVMDVFMIAEPLAGKRDTIVTQTRTAIDFAHALQRTMDKRSIPTNLNIPENKKPPTTAWVSGKPWTTDFFFF